MNFYAILQKVGAMCASRCAAADTHQSFTTQLMRISLATMILVVSTFNLLLATDVSGQHMQTDLVTLGFDRVHFTSVLKKIEQQTKLRFFYRKPEVQLLKDLSLPAGTRTVEETLRQLLKNSSLGFRQVGSHILIERAPADSLYQINGRVVDINKKGIAFASVKMAGKNTTTISRFTQSDSSGYFKLRTEARGEYLLTISAMGMDSVTVGLTLGGNNQVDLPELLMEQHTTRLQEVMITSRRPLIEQRIDRLVYNIGNSVTASGGDAVDALTKVPGVRVANQQVGIVGKSAMRLMVNDRLIEVSEKELISYLKSIRAEDIAAIEVLSNPPAKYDAAGNSGLINIRLKRNNTQGFSGNLRQGLTKSSYSAYSAGANLNYLAGGFSAFSSLNLENGATRSTENDRLFYPLQRRTGQSVSKDDDRSISARAGLDYQLNESSSVGLQYLGANSRPDSRDETRFDFMDLSSRLDSSLFTNGYNDNKINYHSINAHYLLALDTSGTKLSMDANYFDFNNNQKRSFSTIVRDGLGQEIVQSRYAAITPADQRIKVYTAKLDLEKPYQFANLAAGAKLTMINTDNSLSMTNTISGSQQSDLFVYKERIQAVYGSAQRKFGDKWEAMAGLRMEFTQTQGHSLSLGSQTRMDYYQLFPTAYLMYRGDADHTFTLNYGKRINRPGYAKLNPFRWYFNPIYYMEGNPFLRPSFNQNMELGFSYKDRLILKLDAALTRDGFGQVIQVTAGDAVQAIVNENYYSSRQVGFLASYHLSLFKFWESANQFYAYYNHTRSLYPGLQPRTRTLSAFGTSNNSFRLNSSGSMFAEVNLSYQLPRKLELFEFSASSQLDLGLRADVLKKKFQLSFSVADVLGSNRPVNTTYTNGIKQEYRNYYDTRRARFSVIYKFGNSKIAARKRELGNEEERERSN